MIKIPNYFQKSSVPCTYSSKESSSNPFEDKVFTLQTIQEKVQAGIAGS